MAGLGALGGSGVFAGKSLAVLGAGLLAGAVGGSALVASGTVQFGGNAGAGRGAAGGPGLELVPCPDQGPVIGSIPRDQQVLVTGRSADGAWLQLYWPAPGIASAWTKAGALQLEGDAGSLPVKECDAPPTPSPRPTVEPTPTPQATPSPTPTPSPTASPTPAAKTPPALSKLTASTATISFDQGAYCAGDPKSVTISVSASDDDGLASVTLRSRPPGASEYREKAMTLSGGRYVATLDTTADNLKTAGDLRYYVVARDKAADQASSRIPKASATITVKVCKNTGPTLRTLAASNGTIGTIRYVDGPPTCPNQPEGTEISVIATDVDGVKGVNLYFKKPGATKYQIRPMELLGGANRWRTDINIYSDDIRAPGTLSYYVIATDNEGLKTKSSTKSVKVVRCDSEASIIWNAAYPDPLYVGQYCSPTYPDLILPISAVDVDNGDTDSRRLKVTVQWEVSSFKSGIVGSGTTVAAFTRASGFRAYIPTTAQWLTGERSFSITFTVRTTDIYGGTTSVSGTDSFIVSGCIG